MNKQLNYLKQLLKYLEYHNLMAPFPLYDTEYVEKIRSKLEEMEKQDIDYDELPTASCKHCDSLGLHQDELDNDICLRCGAVNEINVFPSYYIYELYITSKENEDN